jgi:thiamine-monophosphate kinase
VTAAGGEDALVDWLRGKLGVEGAVLGDDAALLDLPAGGWAATVDSQIEGIHFPSGLPPERIGRRLLAVNLSDLAAVGAEPSFALLALAAPPDYPRRPLLAALAGALTAHRTRLVGGDLARSPRLVASLTLVGRLPSGGRWLRRGQARAGDRLWVGGTLGESAAGRQVLAAGARWPEGQEVGLPAQLAASSSADTARRAVIRHLAPEPQLALGRWLGTRDRAAAIDLSDGLARDLHRLVAASGVAAEVDAAALPTPLGLPVLAALLETDPHELVLAGGEDYVLLFTLPEAEVPPAEHGCVAIGRIAAGQGVTLVDGTHRRPLEPEGWDHLG